MLPVGVAAETALWRRRRAGGVAFKPALDAVVVELFRPEHPGQRLPQNQSLVRRRPRRRELGVELVRLRLALVELGVKVAIDGRTGRAQPELDRRARPRVDGNVIAERCLGPRPPRIHGRGARDNVIVDAVLGEPAATGNTPQALGVGFVVAEEHLRRSLRGQKRPS